MNGYEVYDFLIRGLNENLTNTAATAHSSTENDAEELMFNYPTLMRKFFKDNLDLDNKDRKSDPRRIKLRGGKDYLDYCWVDYRELGDIELTRGVDKFSIKALYYFQDGDLLRIEPYSVYTGSVDYDSLPRGKQKEIYDTILRARKTPTKRRGLTHDNDDNIIL